ncbi:MAG: hypothetical protein CMD54_04950 [Gammaproteobacteria bacterium]|nr:hypothetical protein [Gammaproteobacteria bacterium]
MNDPEIISRFEELDAGRILGDLDAGEMDEWEKLARDPRCQSDLSLELAAAALEAEFQDPDGVELPPGLLEELQKGTADFVVQKLSKEVEEKVVEMPLWQKVLSGKNTPWAMAAIFALLFVAQTFVSDPSTSTPGPTTIQVSPEEASKTLVAEGKDLIRTPFEGGGDYKGMSGEVVWSDERQEGYMFLTDLPVNDPESKQYQLWIVDPTRDEKPVDGGVFDIASAEGTTVIPIRNPLLIRDPKAFVITLEQPGGVVVSKQEVVVAVANS